MNDEELKQRLKYLVEHGGIWDDPIADVRKSVRVLYVMLAIALAFHVVEAIAAWV